MGGAEGFAGSDEVFGGVRGEQPGVGGGGRQALPVDLEVLAIAAEGNVVFTERVDRFRWQGKSLDLPVTGVFEVREGKIIAHRDYFDYETWMNATGVPLG